MAISSAGAGGWALGPEATRCVSSIKDYSSANNAQPVAFDSRQEQRVVRLRPRLSPAPASSLYLQRNAHRAMIAAHDVRVDLGLLHFLRERFGDQHIVDSPSDVTRACVREL